MNADGRRYFGVMVWVVTIEDRPVFIRVYLRESAVKDSSAGTGSGLTNLRNYTARSGVFFRRNRVGWLELDEDWT